MLTPSQLLMILLSTEKAPDKVAKWETACAAVFNHANNADLPAYLNAYNSDTQAAITSTLPMDIHFYVSCAMWIWYNESSRTGFIVPTQPAPVKPKTPRKLRPTFL